MAGLVKKRRSPTPKKPVPTPDTAPSSSIRLVELSEVPEAGQARAVVEVDAEVPPEEVIDDAG